MSGPDGYIRDVFLRISQALLYHKEAHPDSYQRAHQELSTFSLVTPPSHNFGSVSQHLLIMADSAGMMYALATVFSILAIVAIMLRFYARRIKQTALAWDDYVILPALVRHFQMLHI